ncbi:MAG TPA: HEAT repeat domain-containing protein [Myxococcota bacterium]|nr:HEAT repeat domain-containing protein [Myxococcota bacterium]
MRDHISDEEIREIHNRAGQFSLLLVKALLQTGTYDASHPIARAATADMFAAFSSLAQDTDELTYLLLSTVDGDGILVDGLLSEPIPIKSVFRGMMGDHFLNKFHDYFARNRIASFSIKTSISAESFTQFLAYLTAWGGEGVVGHRSAEEFSRELLELGLFDVTIISIDELVGGKRHLAWPVKIALSRMRKDISKLPMLRNADRAEVQRLKIAAMSDIIRPIKRPDTLRDLMLNADLVADGIQITSTDEVEDTLITAMTADAAFDVAEALLAIKQELSSARAKPSTVGRTLDELDQTTARCLAKIITKLALLEYRNAFGLMEVCYRNNLISLDNLPRELQRKMRAAETTDKFLSNSGQYLSDFDTCVNPQSYLKYLNVFTVVIPELVDRSNRQMVSAMLGVLARHHAEGDLTFQGRRRFIDEGLQFLSSGTFLGGLVQMVVGAPKDERADLEAGAALFKELIVPHLIGVLVGDGDMSARTAAASVLQRIGAPAIEPLTDELRAHRHGWQPLRLVIRLLGQLKALEAERNIFQYASHPHPKVREVCLTALYELLGPDSEKYLISFIRDPEKLVARRAITNLALLHSTNNDFLQFIYDTIRVRHRGEDEPEDTVQAVCLRALAEYDRVLMPRDPDLESALASILSTRGMKTMLPGRLGLRAKSSDLQALAVVALAARGGERNKRLIDELKSSQDEKVAAAANDAMNRLAEAHQRFMEQPAD